MTEEQQFSQLPSIDRKIESNHEICGKILFKTFSPDNDDGK